MEVVADDPTAKVRELKRQDGKDIWLLGGADLAGALHPQIDRLIVKISPLTIGDGIPLFSPKAGFDPRLWQLTDHTTPESGVLFLTYHRAADSEARG